MRAVGRTLGLTGQTSPASMVFGALIACGIGALGIAVGPAIVFSVPSEPAEIAVNAGSLSADEAEAAEGVRRLISSSAGLIHIRTESGAAHGRDARATGSAGRDARATGSAGRDAGAGADCRLWIDDARDAGAFNEDELLILAHVPLLRTVFALTVTPSKATGPRIRTRELFSDDLADRWRARADVQQAVVATDVTAMLIETIGRNSDGVGLRVRLTFARAGSDLGSESRRDAEFVVRVRDALPDGAKGAGD